MTDLEPSRDDYDQRSAEWESRYGLSEVSYPEVVAAAIAHRERSGPPATPPWLCQGPRNLGGRIISIAQHPAIPGILYAGSAQGGLWRTLDGGDTWDNVGPAGVAVPVGTIAISEQRPSHLYIGTGAHDPSYPSGIGLYRATAPSPQGPLIFEHLARAPDATDTPASAANGRALRYTRIEIDPEDSNRFWVASQTGLWRGTYDPSRAAQPVEQRVDWIREFPTERGGASAWPLATRKASGSNTWPSYATDLRVRPDPRSDAQFDGRVRYLVLYVAVYGAGIYRGRFDRKDGSVDWQRELPVPFPANYGRVLVDVCEHRPKNVFCVVADLGAGRIISPLYRSKNNGNSWTDMGQPRTSGQADYDLVLAVSPASPDVVFCGEVEGSLNRHGDPARWEHVLWSGRLNRGDPAQHADQHAALFDRFDHRRLWVGNDGGLAMAPDISRNIGALGFWQKRSHGINAAQIQDVATHDVLPNVAAMGLQDNATWLGFGGRTWYMLGSGDGGEVFIDAGNPRRLMKTTQGGLREAMPALATTGGVTPWFRQRVIPDIPATDSTMFMRLAVFDGRVGPFIGIVDQNPRSPGTGIYGLVHDPSAVAPFSGRTLVMHAGLGPPASAITDPTTSPPGEECSVVRFGPPVPFAEPRVAAWIGTSHGNLYHRYNNPAASAAQAAARFTAVPTALPFRGNLWRRVSAVATHPQDRRIVAVAANPVMADWKHAVEISIQGGGGIAAPGPIATIQWQRVHFVRHATFNNRGMSQVLGPATPAAGPLPAAATIVIPGAGVTLLMAAGNYVAGERWRVDLGDGNVAQTNAAGGTGAITALAHARSNVTIRFTSNGGVGGAGAAQFTWQIGAGPAQGAGTALAATFEVPETFLTLAFAAGAHTTAHVYVIAPDGTVTRQGGAPATVTAFARPGGQVLLSYDQGQSWLDVSDRGDVPAATDVNGLPPGPVAALRFDVSSAGADLYAGTLGGVYRLRNVPTPTGLTLTPAGPLSINPLDSRQLTAFVQFSVGAQQDATSHVDWSSSGANVTVNAQGMINAAGAAGSSDTITATRGIWTATLVVNITASPPAAAVPAPPPAMAPVYPRAGVGWLPFNNGLPAVLVTDIETVAQSRILRVGTFGRGIWDCDLDGAPDRRLYLRQTLLEDGRGHRATMIVTITTTGAVGAARFQVQIGHRPPAAATLTAAAVAVPDTHVTLGFPAGTYTQDDVWTLSPAGTVTPGGANAAGPDITATITERVIPGLLNSDPRQPAAGAPNLDHVQGYDIRVARAPFGFFGAVVDGADFDELMSVEAPKAMETCAVYVQVHNAGTRDVANTDVRLFFCQCATPVGGAIPALPPTGQLYAATPAVDAITITITTTGAVGAAQFTHRFATGAVSAAQATAATVNLPNGPAVNFGAGNYDDGDSWEIGADGHVRPQDSPTSTGVITLGAGWRQVPGAPTITTLRPDTPRVVRFDWKPPVWLAGNVALLAVCRASSDPLTVPLPGNINTIAGLIANERRAILRVLPVIAAATIPSIHVRDGVDDDGRQGATAFVARSPDIIISPQAQASPAEAFKDLLDLRPQSRLIAGVDNHLYVRVTNDGPVDTTARVQIWAVPLDTTGTPSTDQTTWHFLAAGPTAAVAAPAALQGPIDVPVAVGRQAYVHLNWNSPPDPNAGDDYKAYGLIAVVNTVDNADPMPDLATIVDLPTFWDYFATLTNSDNAGLRTVTWQS